jgi:CRP/FNR family transcriptional regulator, dissimilatory nitrate respiration regulator
MNGVGIAGYDCNHMRHLHEDFARDLPIKRQSYADREKVFAAGGLVRRFFRVEAGAIRLIRTLPEGTLAVMHTARAGEWVAESSLYSDRYHCDAVADGVTIASSVSKAGLLARFAAEPQRCLAFSQVLADRLRHLRAVHEIVRMRKADARVMHWFHLHASGNPPVVQVDQPWSRVAEDVGLTREAFYRTMAALRKSGAISERDGTVTVAVRHHHNP